MNKILLIITILLSNYLIAKVNTIVSILPQKTFVKAIGGDKVNVSLMVKPGNSPHTYEPKPSQMRDISKADIYFAIGVEFEKIWLPKFTNQNNTMKIANLAKNITKSPIIKHHHESEDSNHHDEHANEQHEEKISLDPHIWTSTNNVKIIIKNILDTLVIYDKKNESYYKQNYINFLSKINATDKKIKKILKDTKKEAKFMVFHPAWGYFAKQYNLIQLVIEVEGKSPKPKQIAYLIEEAKEENVNAILTAPEFSDSIAKQIANELNISVIKISPLNPKWSQNLINLANAITNK